MKVSRLQKVTAGLAVIAVIAGGVAVVSEIDANNRIAEAFSGTTEVVAATKTIRAGDEISASDLAFVSVPNSTVADGAITKKDIDDSSKTPVGRVATQYIAKAPSSPTHRLPVRTTLSPLLPQSGTAWRP